MTFDTEEWYFEKNVHGGRDWKYRQFDELLDRLLPALDRRGLKATFFCLGKMATDYPYVVKKIHAAGHEIGCHSHVHTWMNKLTPAEALADTRQAVDVLEQLIGEKVKSYRAPAFSVGETNTWFFEVLAECGITRDASVFPASRELGGFRSYGNAEPATIQYGNAIIHEFPVNTMHLFGKNVVCTGGGYFRIFPYWLIHRLVKNSNYVMFYFHLADILDEKRPRLTREQYERYFKEPGTFLNRWKRQLKTNIGVTGAFAKLEQLLDSEQFVNVDKADELTDWTSQRTITIKKSKKTDIQ